MGDHFGVGLAAEFRAVLAEPFPQFAEVLDDTVMRDRDAVGGVRMRVALVRLAVRRPAGMADADIAGERLLRQALFQRRELAFGAAAAERAVIERGDAGGVVAAVFEAFERLDQVARDRLTSDDSDDPAHPSGWPLCSILALTGNRKHMEIKTHFAMCQMAGKPRATHMMGYFGFFLPKLLSARKRLAQPALLTCSPRPMASAPAGTSLVTTVPVPT